MDRPRIWTLRQSYVRSLGNPMEDPFRLQRPARGQRIRPADRPEFEPVDVSEIRERFALSQVQFARMLGISVETLRNWERGRRRPVGPSRALLRIAAAHPDVVADVLRNARMKWSPAEEDGWEPLDVVVKRHRARRARSLAERAEREELEAIRLEMRRASEARRRDQASRAGESDPGRERSRDREREGEEGER